MDLSLFLVGFPFSFFLLLLSYWKQDKNLHIFGSLTLIILAVLLATGVQITSYVPIQTVTTSNVTGNYTTTTYASQVWNFGIIQENFGFALFIAIFTVLEYLYFSIVFSLRKEEDKMYGGD